MKTTSLHQALGIFIEAFRPYVVEKLKSQFRDNWSLAFSESFQSQEQKENWNRSIKRGLSPETQIDFHHLRNFAIKYKDLLKNDFPNNQNKLPTWLDEIAEARHKCNHYQDMQDREISRTFDTLILIAEMLKKPELKSTLEQLQKNETAPLLAPSSGLLPWFHVVEPHLDIRQGNLDESVYAANLGEIVLGGGREVYKNTELFFKQTYFTQGLKSILKRVIRGLAGIEDSENRVISLQTGFGGGKTHTLIALYHVAQSGNRTTNEEITNIFKEIKIPNLTGAKIAVFTNTTNDPVQGRKTDDGIELKTIWGDLAYQLGGSALYESIRENDENRISPKGIFKKVLEKASPCLILLDELADYCVAASGVKVGNSTLADQTISFAQELTVAVSEVSGAVLVATLPVSKEEVANTELAVSILTSLSARFGRVGADTKPVADEEIYAVLRKRLFSSIGSEQVIKQVVSKYMQMYEEHSTEIPSFALKSEYKEKLTKTYPFHPDLIDVFRVRWASHSDFQRTRGVLRLLASIVSDLWSRKNSLKGENYFIHTSDIVLENLDSLTGQLKKLYGSGYEAVIQADVSGNNSNASKIESDNPELNHHALARGIAVTVLLGSFGSDGPNKGLSIPELKLSLLKPDSFNHNLIHTALDRLEATSYYLYYSSVGSKRYWYFTKPNINILINQAKSDIKEPDIEAEIVKKVREKTMGISAPHILVDSSDDIPEQQKLTLVILHPKYLSSENELPVNTSEFIKKVSTKKGNSDRIYRNTILFLTCSIDKIGILKSDMRDSLACLRIQSEYASQIDKDQKEDIRKKTEEASKKVDLSIALAYSNILKHSAANGISQVVITKSYESLLKKVTVGVIETLKEAEWLLVDGVGFSVLKNANLTPTPSNPKRIKDIYESFLRYDDKLMIFDESTLQKGLQTLCANGQIAIGVGDGVNFTKFYENTRSADIRVLDDSYWIVDPADIKKAETGIPGSGNISSPSQPSTGTNTITPTMGEGETPIDSALQSIVISGKVPLEKYTDLFSYFVAPTKLANLNLDIEIKFTVKRGTSTQLNESLMQYKSMKEAAKQLGLNFIVEK